MQAKQIQFAALPPLVEAIDEARGDMSRNVFIRKVLGDALNVSPDGRGRLRGRPLACAAPNVESPAVSPFRELDEALMIRGGAA